MVACVAARTCFDLKAHGVPNSQRLLDALIFHGDAINDGSDLGMKQTAA
jgi:hypothetical protein